MRHLPAILSLILLAFCASAQSTVYLRSSAPAAVYITNAAWTGSTYKLTTLNAHNLSVGQTVVVAIVCTSSAPGSTINGIRTVSAVDDALNFEIQTLAGANIANSGSWVNCGLQASVYGPWVGVLTPYTLASGPLGLLDGTTGPLFRKLALSTSTGNVATGLANTGSCPGDGVCVSGGVVTITTTYPHGVQVSSAGGKQEYFGIWGTTSSVLNQNGTGTKGTSYAVTAATTYTFSATVPAGVSNGDYTVNAACGSNGITYDAINGTANCVVISQLAYTGNPYWTTVTGRLHGGSQISGRHPWDGGTYNGSYIWSDWNLDGIYTLVDQANAGQAAFLIYALDNYERGIGVSFSQDESLASQDINQIYSAFGAANLASAAWPFLSPTEKSTLLNKIYNDYDDPTDSTSCTPTRNNIANNQQLIPVGAGTAAGTFGSGTSGTSFQLGTGFPAAGIVNNVIRSNNGGAVGYGLVTAYNTSTGAGTVASWSNTSPVSGSTYKILQSGLISADTAPSQQASGSIQPGSTTTSVTLQAGTSGNYANMEIYFPSLNQRAFISAYNTGTLAATLTPALASAPPAGIFYSISNTATVTGYNTNFTTVFAAGDAIYFTNGPENNEGYFPTKASYVVNVASDTSMYVVNAAYVTAPTITPAGFYNLPGWQAGDCGYSWGSKFIIEDPGASPYSYPTAGGLLNGIRRQRGERPAGILGWRTPEQRFLLCC